MYIRKLLLQCSCACGQAVICASQVAGIQLGAAPCVMSSVYKRVVVATLIGAASLPGYFGLAKEATSIEFNRDIRPIITENCFACHGPDKNQRKAKLRLDIREVALERGAIVPGKPGESKLVEHIFSNDPDEVMPPPKSRKTLSGAQKELLRNWIAAGAEYEPHWAYIPLRRPAVPQVETAFWVRNPIDSFILHTLETKQIRPSPQASKAELLRRLSLDLIGLPPAPEELDAFLKDTSPAAYETQINRLLASPHFGERMAVPWLDVVRFADTVGYHGDQNQNIFPYRDYVIDAFNRNKPFDQFTLEQIAGDLLPAPTTEQQVASGFNRLNMVTREGGAQDKEYLAKYAADRVRTVSIAWLGSTMGCAECHDHKYDPFTSKDFYQMEAFFADLKQWGVYNDYEYTPNADLKGWDNDHPFPPEIQVDSPYLQQRMASLRKLQSSQWDGVAAKLRNDPVAYTALQAWRKEAAQFLQQNPSGWLTPLPQVRVTMKDTNAIPGTNFVVRPDATIQFSSLTRERTRVVLALSNIWVSAIRLEIVPLAETEDSSGGPTRFKSSALVMNASLKRESEENPDKLRFYFAEADHKSVRYSNGRTILGVKDRWQISPYHEKQTAVWILDEPIQVTNSSSLTLELGGFAVASARASLSPFGALEPLDSGTSLSLKNAFGHPMQPGPADRDLVERTFLLNTAWDEESLTAIRNLQNDIRECRGGKAFTMVSLAREPYVMRVLRRGNWQDETGEVVQPEVPHFLPQIPNPDHRRLSRLDLAHWLVSPQNPLTARAVMNRLWKQFFGTGISAVVDDLGAQGEWPVHPELLDWLACEFMQPSTSAGALSAQDKPAPWDLKHMAKLIVMSTTYRQESNQRPELKEIDPNNRLLACQSPRRLEAEFVRDNALAIAGLLNGDIGGPSSFPYQPAGYYSYLQFPDRDYRADKGERQYRRGLYTHWQRAFLHPMLANFDAPSREECTANRIVSDTPQQALTLLNDPTFVEASRAFATHLLGSGSLSETQRLDAAFHRALARSPKPRERDSLLDFLTSQKQQYGSMPDDAVKLLRVGNTPAPKSQQVELAAWTQVCRVILNLHETITRY